MQLLAPLLLAGSRLPAGSVIRLGADVALMLVHQRRARSPRAAAPTPKT